jgi:hypothetical protein
MKPPLPLSKAFLVCDRVVDHDHKFSLAGMARGCVGRSYPAAQALGFFARLTSAHGQYVMEVQLQSPDGDVLWRDGPPEPLPMPDPLEEYDLKFNLNVAFPKAGTFYFVLTGNGEEIARQRFIAELAPKMADRS